MEESISIKDFVTGILVVTSVVLVIIGAFIIMPTGYALMFDGIILFAVTVIGAE